MEKLTFKIDCLWGKYLFEAAADEGKIVYRSSSDIEGFTDKEGTLDDPRAFLNLIEEAHIEKWEKEYKGENGIEDAIKWSVEFEDGGHRYLSSGEEAFWPYGYDKLIQAIRLVDEDIDRF